MPGRTRARRSNCFFPSLFMLVILFPLTFILGSISLSLAEEVEYENLRGLARAAQDKNSRESYNRQARDHIFRLNNIGRAENEIDLHGLYVQEAKDILRERIGKEIEKGGSGIHV